MASKTDYFNQMYEYARQAGLSDHLARLAVTQSALETGYGRSVKGNNYFGIKAGKSWNGPSQTFKTWEDVGGKRVNITDKFRKYDNPVDAFKDWEKMIGKRWPAALTAKDLPSAIDGLKYGQQGGYASDQKYKQKLMSIDRQGQRLYNNAPLFAGDIPIPTPRQPKPIQTAQLTGKAAASAEGSANLGMGRGLANLAPNGLRGVEMANAGATRSQPITSSLMSSINQAVENVYGPGYKAQVYSGGQPAKGTSGNRVGTIRHDGGKAGDTYIVDPNGKRLSGDALAPLAQYWAANKIGGVGLEMAGGGIHLDEWSTPPARGTMAWSYNKLTPTQSSAIDQGLKGEWPQVAAFNRPPIPTPRQPMALMAQAKAADRGYNPGGIVDAPKVSLNPVSSANAGEWPQVTRSPLPAIQERIRPMPTSAPAKTSTGVGYSLATVKPDRPMPTGNVQAYAQPTNRFAATPQRTQGTYSDARPMPTGTIPQRVSAPVQSTPAPRYNPLPSGPVAPSVSPQTMAAAYGQYAQTRMAAPSTPMQANPAAAPFTVKATAGQMTTQPIVGPLSNAPIQAPVAATTGQFKKFTPIQKIQQKLKTAVEPENLKAMGGQLAGGAAGSLLGGPIGGILGGLIGKQIMSQPQGQGLLAGLFGGGNNGYQGQSTYIGNGVNAVDRAMYGNRAGDTATYNSQGGGTVTNLGNGSSQRTSSKYGWTETTHADGSKSIKYK